MKGKHNVSNHLSEERIDRAVFIGTTIGFGEIIKKAVRTNKEGKERCYCITDTGVIIVKTLDEQVVITMYIAQFNQVSWIYGKEKIPTSLIRTVRKNEKNKMHDKCNGK